MATKAKKKNKSADDQQRKAWMLVTKAGRTVDAVTPEFVAWMENTGQGTSAKAMTFLKEVSAVVTFHASQTGVASATDFDPAAFEFALNAVRHRPGATTQTTLLVESAMRAYLNFLHDGGAWTGSSETFAGVRKLIPAQAPQQKAVLSPYVKTIAGRDAQTSAEAGSAFVRASSTAVPGAAAQPDVKSGASAEPGTRDGAQVEPVSPDADVPTVADEDLVPEANVVPEEAPVATVLEWTPRPETHETEDEAESEADQKSDESSASEAGLNRETSEDEGTAERRPSWLSVVPDPPAAPVRNDVPFDYEAVVSAEVETAADVEVRAGIEAPVEENPEPGPELGLQSEAEAEAEQEAGPESAAVTEVTPEPAVESTPAVEFSPATDPTGASAHGSAPDWDAIIAAPDEDQDITPPEPLVDPALALGFFARLPFTAHCRSLLAWVGAGTAVSGAGVVRLTDIHDAAAAVGVRATGVRAAALADPGLPHARSMSDVRRLAAIWEALMTYGVLEVSASRVHPGENAGHLSYPDADSGLSLLRRSVGLSLKHLLDFSEHGEDAPSLTHDLSAILAAILTDGSLNRADVLSRCGYGSEIAQREADARLLVERLEEMAQLGFISVNEQVTVSEFMVPILVEAIRVANQHS